ncbi:putative protein p51 [Peptoclostridium acidaminophilum DSM 3953]|uniref:DUF2800 domain-containing protein n=1 Tax=Peptoclostridium acidaminophilum DSM 3953 TaxID=1286171 RepID=W8U8U5_PEPAC|nr:DUF2800 domain-containing protein [Peptoclostridium acidaminophilum]AHM57276.1 putative protein p51 [Peptoclostridium acidaminophilum DSM 3953]
MGSHALLSASGAHRWLSCSPSVRLEEEMEDVTTTYALEGTFMHELSELHLSFFLGSIKEPEFDERLEKMKRSEFFTDEIEKAVETYVDLVIEKINEARATSKDPLVLVEERLDYSPWVKEGFGTGDALIVADGMIEVIDLKGGKGVAVSAAANPQMRLYALGAINGFGMLYDTERVRMSIIQPRLDNISTDEMEASELLSWAEEVVRPRAEKAWAGEGEFKPGEHCRFCKVKATCRARCIENMRLSGMDFKEPPLLSDEEVAAVLRQVGELQKWASDVESYALDAAVNAGKQWPGMKLVEGRSTRRFTCETQVAEKLLHAGYPEDFIYSRSLLSLTKLEKEIGKEDFQRVIGDLIERPPGRLKLVFKDDKRPQARSGPEQDFK